MDGRPRHQLGQAEPEGPLGPPVSAVQPADLRCQPARLLPTERSAASRQPRGAAGLPSGGPALTLGVMRSATPRSTHSRGPAARASRSRSSARALTRCRAAPAGHSAEGSPALPCSALPRPTLPGPASHPAPAHLGPQVAALCSAPAPAAAAAAAPPTRAPNASASAGRSSAGRHGQARGRRRGPRSAPLRPARTEHGASPDPVGPSRSSASAPRAASISASRSTGAASAAALPPSIAAAGRDGAGRGRTGRGRLGSASRLGPQLRSAAATEDSHERLPAAARPAREYGNRPTDRPTDRPRRGAVSSLCPVAVLCVCMCAAVGRLPQAVLQSPGTARCAGKALRPRAVAPPCFGSAVLPSCLVLSCWSVLPCCGPIARTDADLAPLFGSPRYSLTLWQDTDVSGTALGWQRQEAARVSTEPFFPMASV